MLKLICTLMVIGPSDGRERDPSFVSETYSECYPGYQEYNTEIASDDEEDLTQMDMGRQVCEQSVQPALADRVISL